MKSAKWDITSTCNLRCRHCSVADMYFRGINIPQLSINDRLRVIDRLADGGVTNLSLLGGEPMTLGDELFILLARAQQRQINISIVTNATLLNADICCRLIDSGLDRLVVSIEGPSAEIHDQIRGKGNFERTIRNLETFISLRQNEQSPRLSINTVLSRPNRKAFTQMIPFCRDLGANEWSALTLNLIGNANQNLRDLVVSEEEHTEVALEIGQLLKSPGFELRELEIHLMLIYPLVWEYLCKKYNVNLPQPQICCSAGISLVYISPTGDVHLCDRVNSSGYTGKELQEETIHPISLLTHKFDEIWNSKQFVEMFSFVKRAETYAGYEPCNRCKYFFDRTCNPCPLESYRSKHIRFEECLKAEAYLGKISRYDDEPRTSWEKVHQFNPVPLPYFDIEAYKQICNLYPSSMIGTRHTVQTDGTALLMQPQNLNFIKVNHMGEVIWNLIDGCRTTNEVVTSSVELYTDIYNSLGKDPDLEEIRTQATQEIKSFILWLKEQRFIEFHILPIEHPSVTDLAAKSIYPTASVN